MGKHLEVRSAVILFLSAMAAIGRGDPLEPNAEAFEKTARGETIIYPADVGTTNTILGRGFSETAMDVDADGKTHRLFPPNADATDEDRYECHLDIITNTNSLKANGRLLFARGWRSLLH